MNESAMMDKVHEIVHLDPTELNRRAGTLGGAMTIPEGTAKLVQYVIKEVFKAGED